MADNDINARSQIYLLEACRQHNPTARVVYTSTRQFYGVPQYLPVDEAHPVQPTDVNGITKWAGEQYHLVYHRAHGIPATALRLTNVYGPRQVLKDAERTLWGSLYHFVRKVLAREKLRIFGDGEQLRDYVYVEDVVESLRFCSPVRMMNAVGRGLQCWRAATDKPSAACATPLGGCGTAGGLVRTRAVPAGTQSHRHWQCLPRFRKDQRNYRLGAADGPGCGTGKHLRVLS